MANLSFNDLPKDIQECYKSKDIHKIIRNTKTIINIYLKNMDKENWKKSGDRWQRL